MSLEPRLYKALTCLKQGGLIGYPTETLYGLGCDALNVNAVSELLRLKRRPAHKGLIILASKAEHIDQLLQSEQWRQQIPAEPCDPPSTWLVAAPAKTPYWLIGPKNKLALRFSSHPLARQLCDALRGPIVSTSANPSGRPAAFNALQARHYFKNRLCCYVAGRGTSTGTTASRIIDSHSGQIIRA
ncbi:MAG: L-threonylcarbamoyladenylate synthase [gamma proteobacterium symbiont of Bathyaustriella thionipta]|nr:L-threonylcarbamoyladenylate synthase [gamma proteobacterium symbiont of Bathyaustriella thionipta]